MRKVLFGVSPIGLGHATRSVAIGAKLKRKEIELEFATGGNAASFIRSYGFKVHDVVTAPVPFESHGKVKLSSLWYIRYWLAYRSSYSRMLALIDRLKPDIIVGDEEFSSVSIALDRGIKHALVLDELDLNFARSLLAELIERKVRRWYSALQRRVSLIIIPDFGEDAGKIRYLSPVVREVTKSRAQILAEYSLPRDGLMIVFSPSGSGLGKFFEEKTVEAFNRSGLKNAYLVVVGGERKAQRNERVFNLGFIPDNQNIIAAADLVVSSAGKSTIDEAMSSGTPIIAIPFKNHFEQERNAKNLGFHSEDLSRLDILICERIGKRSKPLMYGGAENAATLIASL